MDTRITKNIESAYVTHSYKLRQDGRSSIKVDRKIAAISATVALTKLRTNLKTDDCT